jgi:hypothetical protein
LRSE